MSLQAAIRQATHLDTHDTTKDATNQVFHQATCNVTRDATYWTTGDAVKETLK